MSGVVAAKGNDIKEDKMKNLEEHFTVEKVSFSKHISSQMRMEEDGNLSPGGCFYFLRPDENTVCWLEIEGIFQCHYACLTSKGG